MFTDRDYHTCFELLMRNDCRVRSFSARARKGRVTGGPGHEEGRDEGAGSGTDSKRRDISRDKEFVEMQY
jgi:hypothetical protein